MKTLIIDTSLSHLQVALFEDERLVADFSNEQRHRLGDVFHEKLQKCLQEASWSPKVLNRIIVTQGPGSFTGVRVGLSAARGLATALAIPIYGISSLQAMALSVREACLCAVDSRRGDYFVQHFDAHHMPVSDITIMNDESLEQQNMVVKDKPLDLAAINDFFLDKDLQVYEAPKPIYVREADAALPKNLPSLDW